MWIQHIVTVGGLLECSDVTYPRGVTWNSRWTRRTRGSGDTDSFKVKQKLVIDSVYEHLKWSMSPVGKCRHWLEINSTLEGQPFTPKDYKLYFIYSSKCPPGCRLPEIQIQNISTWEKPLTVIGPICSSSGKWGRCWSWRSRWSWRTWTPIVTNPWWSCWPLGSGRARYWISLWTLTWKRKIQIKNLEHQIF